MPRKGFVEFEPFWYQQEAINDDSQFRLINKSRQIGFSTVMGAEAAWEVTHIPGAVIILLSKNQAASKNLLKYVYNILESVQYKDPDFPPFGKKNELEISFPTLGSRIVSIPASKEAGRSYSASHWYFDEIAHTPYVEDIFQAAAPTIAQTGGRITVFSSPKGKNLFYELYSRPEDYGFTVFKYPWWVNPVYNPYVDQMLKVEKDSPEWAALLEKAKQGDWYKKTRKKYSELAFQQEFECDFDSDEDSVFTTRQLEKVFRKNWLTPLVDPECPSMDWFTSDRIPGHYYVTGIDLGRKRDPSVAITYDITEIPAKVAEYKRIPPGSADWEQILLTIRKTYSKFESDMLCDSTGIGDVIHERISDICDAYVLSDNQYSRNKYNLIELTRSAMDNKAFRIPKIRQLYKEHEEYLWNDKGIVQDTVIANALAIKQFYEPESMFIGVDTSFNFLEGEVGEEWSTV